MDSSENVDLNTNEPKEEDGKEEESLDEFWLINEIENILPYSKLRYYDKDFWDKRYEKDTSTFEWYIGYLKIQPYVRKYVEGRDYALDVGCGTSSVPSDLSYEGFKKVFGIDFSSKVISSMKERYQLNQNITWIVGNCLAFKSEKKYDLVFDKGTMDCLFCSGNPTLAKRELYQISNALKMGGFFFLVSNGIPKTRQYLFKESGLRLSLVHTRKFEIDIGEGQTSFFFLYILKKE